jgi:predicted dehydrogenase
VTKVAVVGCGAVVEELHLPALTELERRGYLRVACLVDPKADRVKSLQRVFPKARVHQDAEVAYRENSVDLTLITTPPAFHAKAASMAMSRGSHVLCEKPLASSLAEAEAMVTEAQRYGVLLAVGFTRRFFPNLREARELIEVRALGEPMHFVVREGKVYDWPVASESPFRRASGGGVLLDLGSHVLDTLCWFFGEPVIRSCEDDALASGVEANCRVDMAFPNARGAMQLSWDQPLASNLTVIGPRGALRLPAWEMHRWQWQKADGSWEDRVSDTVYADDLCGPARRFRRPDSFNDCIASQLMQCLRAIHRSESLAVTGEAALVSMRALQECRGMAKPLEQDWLPALEREAFKAAHWRAACVPSQSG